MKLEIRAVRVLLVDDNALFLEGLQNLLEANGVAVLGTASSAKQAIELARDLVPNVILMDIEMPGDDGICATRAIKALLPMTTIVILTVSADETHLFEAIKAGATGYLLKSAGEEQFLQALEGMHKGEPPLSPGLAAKIVAEFGRRERERATSDMPADLTCKLSARQAEILVAVAEGRRYKEIAQSMGLSEPAIKYHMGEIVNRLHLENRLQAIAYATKLMETRKVRDGAKRS